MLKMSRIHLKLSIGARNATRQLNMSINEPGLDKAHSKTKQMAIQKHQPLQLRHRNTSTTCLRTTIISNMKMSSAVQSRHDLATKKFLKTILV